MLLCGLRVANAGYEGEYIRDDPSIAERERETEMCERGENQALLRYVRHTQAVVESNKSYNTLVLLELIKLHATICKKRET